MEKMEDEEKMKGNRQGDRERKEYYQILHEFTDLNVAWYRLAVAVVKCVSTFR